MRRKSLSRMTRPHTYVSRVHMAVCLYTVCTGAYESTIRCRGDVLDCDMLYVSDSHAQLRKAGAAGWIPLYITPTATPQLLSRDVKARPYLHLPEKYRYSIYIDANTKPAFRSGLDMVKRMNGHMMCRRHPWRSSTREEARRVVAKGLETRERVWAMIMRARKMGSPEWTPGLAHCNFLVRDHQAAEVRAFGEMWLECITLCRRDQISFVPCLLKCRVNTHFLPSSPKLVHQRKHDGTGSGRRQVAPQRARARRAAAPVPQPPRPQRPGRRQPLVLGAQRTNHARAGPRHLTGRPRVYPSGGASRLP